MTSRRKSFALPPASRWAAAVLSVLPASALLMGALSFPPGARAQAAGHPPAPVGQQPSGHVEEGKKVQKRAKTPDGKGEAPAPRGAGQGSGTTPPGKTQGGSDTRDSQPGGATSGSTGQGGLPGSGASSGSGGTSDQR